MTVEFGLLLVAAYLLGSVPVAYLGARFSHNIDLRQYGSGQTGTSNLIRATSKKIAMPVAIYDFGKGILMVWIAQLVGLDIAQQVAVGVATVVGHNWPVFLKFNGGRGIFTTMGIAFFLMPWGILAFIIVASPTVWLRSSPLPVLAAIAVLPIASWVLDRPLALTLGLLALFLIMVIRRLAVPRTAISASVTTGELLINRLLFDRDIRDGKTWINRRPAKASPGQPANTQSKKQGKG